MFIWANAPALHTCTNIDQDVSIDNITNCNANCQYHCYYCIGAVFYVRIVAMSKTESLPLHKKVRLVLLLASLDVLLPTVDVATDLMLSIKLFTTGYRCEVRLGWDTFINNECIPIFNIPLMCGR